MSSRRLFEGQRTRLLGGVCVGALLAVGASPGAIASENDAADSPKSCYSSVTTYVLEDAPASAPATPGAATRTLRKYVDWNPRSAGADGTLIDTADTASVPASSRLIAGNKGAIYEITGGSGGGGLRLHRDMTGSGGSLLTPRYNFKQNPDQPWGTFEKIWADTEGNVLAIDAGGNLDLYQIVYPSSGTTASMARKARLLATDPALTELRKSSKVWSVGAQVYGLRDGEVRSWPYSFTGGALSLGAAVVIASGLTDAKSAWSPGPGTVYTHSGPSGQTPGSRDYAGVVKGFTGAPSSLSLARDEVRVGIFGEVLVNAVPCLVEAPEDARPSVGPEPDEATVPEAPPAPAPQPKPTGPAKVSGKFVLGDGSPAADLPVTIEAADVRQDSDSAMNLPDLGVVRTGADGAWSLTLPDPLPADIQKAADDNGGALNVIARTEGTTTSGVAMFGTVSLTAAPEAPSTGKPTAFAASVASDSAEPTALLPLLAADAPGNSPFSATEAQTADTYAAEHDRLTVATDEPTPTWQSDRGPAPASYDPYLVKGADIRSEKVVPYRTRSQCEWFAFRESSRIAYTVVGEGHAYWDARSQVEYSNKLSSQFDVAISHGSNWTVSGKVARGSSMGVTTSHAYRGPYYSKQWMVPIEYSKERWEQYCGELPKLKGKYWRIAPGGYKIPQGGATAKIGKDVMSKDGPRNYATSRPEYRAIAVRDSYWGLLWGRSSKTERAATVYGITLGASTSYDSDHAQRIYAGKARRAHYIWGRGGRLYENPGMFHSN